MSKTKPIDAEAFIENGYLRIEAFHPKDRLATIRQQIHDEIKDLSGRRSLSSSLRRLPVFQQIGKLSALVKVARLHEALVTSTLIDCVTQLGGCAPSAIQETRLLLSPPHQGTWTLGGLSWHVDVAARPQDRLPGIQIFFLIDDVARHGGATLALAGSHRVGRRLADSPSLLRKALRTPMDLERKLEELGITVV